MYRVNLDWSVQIVMVMMFRYELIFLCYCAVLIWIDLCICDILPCDALRYEFDYVIYLLFECLIN